MNHFSSSQKFPLYIAVLGLLEFLFGIPLLMYLAGQGSSIPYFLLLCGLPVSVLVLFMMKMFSPAFCNIAISDEGISLVTKFGRVKRKLLWQDVKIYNVSIMPNATNYICISTDDSIAAVELHYPQLSFLMFKNKSVLSFVATPQMICLCNQYVGHLRNRVGKYIYSDADRKKIMNRMWFIFGACCAFALVVMIVIFLF